MTPETEEDFWFRRSNRPVSEAEADHLESTRKPQEEDDDDEV